MKNKWILSAAAFVIMGMRLGASAPVQPPKGPTSTQERSAVHAVMTLNTLQVQYQSQHGRYAGSLAELGQAAAAENHGYKFAAVRTGGGYAISAVPLVFGSTGSRTFYSDQSLIVRENYGPAPATAQSPSVGTAVHRKNDRQLSTSPASRE